MSNTFFQGGEKFCPPGYGPVHRIPRACAKKPAPLLITGLCIGFRILSDKYLNLDYLKSTHCKLHLSFKYLIDLTVP